MNYDKNTPAYDVEAALIAGQNLGDPKIVNGHPIGHPYAIVPEGSKLVDLENMLETPLRPKGNANLRDPESFCRFVLQETTERTRIYGNLKEGRFKAVFNDNCGQSEFVAGWGDYTASYTSPTSTEWATWKSKSGSQMNQVQFAQFIEDNLPDIAQPPAAEMLEVSRTLEAKKKVNFAQGIRLSNGQNELTYEEQIEGSAGKGKFKIPEEFIIGIPVLEGGLRYAVQCRLRYRIADGGNLTMWYEIIRPHKILEDAINEVWTSIEEKTGKKIFNGDPA
jgi:uncharacterized protein YfdQ (DUF2303 family)